MVLEYISQRLKEEKENGNLDVYRMGGTKVETHLSFADDVVLFCRSNKKSMETIKWILKEFEAFSRLCVNK